MIESIRIKHFRCFRDASAEGFGKINVVVGDNAAGKSSFLEALFLVASNSPQTHLKLQRWRSLMGDKLAFTSQDLSSGEFWSDMFHWMDQSEPIDISIGGEPDRRVTVTLDQTVIQEVREGAEQRAPIRFAWEQDDSGPWESEIVFSDDGIRMSTAGPALPGAMIHSTTDPSGAAKRFGELKVEGEVERLMEPLQKAYPEIVEVSPIPKPAEGSLLHGRLEGQKKMLPLAQISNGINRFIYMLSTILAYPGGSIFIDEAASGLYHKRFPAVWSAICNLALDNQTQLFMTTHSGEAVAAMEPTMSKEPENFRLIRLIREGGRSIVDVTPGESLQAAIKQHVEVR